MDFDLLPLIGAGPIRFGMSRAEVAAAIGADPLCFTRSAGGPPVDSFMDGGVQVNYDTAGQVEFVETGRVLGLNVTLGGLDVFGMDADSLISALGADNRLAPSAEPGYSFVFPDIGVSLWRSIQPDGDCDAEGRRFEAVGVSAAGYFGRSD